MKKLPLPLVAALVALAAPAALAVDTPGKDFWVVTSAKATGAGGEQFVTSLRIVNPGTATANVVLKLLAQSALDGSGAALGDNTAGPEASVTIAAGQTLAIDDVLGTKFSVTGAGGLHVTSDVPVAVMSQTLNTNAHSATGAAGAYGFAIPAQTADNALAVGDTAYVSYLSGSPSSASGNRTNLFLQSGNAAANTTVHVKLLRGNGTVVGERDYQLGKLSQTQVNGIVGAFGSTESNLVASVTVTSGGPVFLGASVIDNAIASILYTPPVKSWYPGNASFGLNLDDDQFGFSGRLDVLNGVPQFLSAGLVMNCTSGYLLFFLQAASYPPLSTTQPLNVTHNADGSFAFAGSSKNGDGSLAANYSGTIVMAPDGTVSGQIVYTRSTVAGNQCAGSSKTFPFYGTKFGTLVP